ncbi:hypothetical protein LEP1GSC009_0251 [Leptospira interrogans serovar Grippotyphosa str. Andaman]|nr:hypothetical protein LEP1GSC009_0251 [Leptospira interrogans serovar Grippotyphosa str. Andaman]
MVLLLQCCEVSLDVSKVISFCFLILLDPFSLWHKNEYRKFDF